MNRKFSGKRVKKEFRMYRDRTFLMGVELKFCIEESCGARHLVNLNKQHLWDSDEQKHKAFQNLLDSL
ncbi:hypothetical protein QMA02_28585 [Bacillus wiedmannii]|uniref:hypothetical protein n=1 Tax=Bacillus wiedmannii TaxID=1890302 RepID=UPI0024AE1CA1|nr:hypothetical protein [Bacillus wiedmannii]MDI6679750.1 hypothetical protein [Bacillus wiedmannii]